MRRVLIALAALPVLALPAAAEVRFSGDARMGVVYDSDARDGNDSRLRFDSRAELRIELRGQTDGGLRYGIALDLDELPRTRRRYDD